MQKNEVL